MAGLVNYGSSDEEDLPIEDSISTSNSNTFQASTRALSNSTNSKDAREGEDIERYTKPAKSETNDSDSTPVRLSSVPAGPVLGPTMPTDAMAGSDSPQENGSFAPQSPYSVNRAMMRDLTLPSIPNYDIPPSPPGSPIASTNDKFKHFLELKKQGVHFNEKLSKSAALKNPSLMQKLMDFAGIDEVAEYATTLPKELWEPAGLPEAGYKENLAKSQKKILKMREEEKAKGLRTSLDFVPATASGESSKNGTPRIGQSTSERVMAGLEKGRSSSPHIQGVKRKTRFES